MHRFAAATLLVLAACESPAPREAAARQQDTVAAQPAADTTVSAAARLMGLDSAVLRARIDSVFAKFARPGSPGCIVTVMDAGRIVFGRGYGSADIARGTPFTTASAFDAASMAKQFITFGILLLEREGKLSLDDPVQKHLPELPDYGAPVTLRHLIHHTSGLRDAETGWFTGGRIEDPALIPSLSFVPGTRHVYDDTGYDLLHRITERVSGESIGQFQRTRIFGPLGMTSTATSVRRVRAYAPNDSGGGFHLAMTEENGGFTTTPEDLARWDANFYDARVGGREVVDAMMREGRLNSGETIPYAMALHTEPYRGLRRLWHGGLSQGYRSQFMRYPDQRTSVLVMCNVYQYAEPNSLAERVSDIVLADEIARAERRDPASPPASAAPPPSAAGMRRLAGVYVNRDEQFVRAVRVHEGRLQMRQWITWYGLRPLGGGRFRVEGQPLTLTFRDAAQGRVLEEQADGRRSPMVLHAVPDEAPSPAELDRYTGVFRSDELRSTWTITRAGGELRVSGGPRGGLRLRPAGPDAFTDGTYVLVLFRRDPAGRVTGLTAATQRIQNLQFTRRGS
jgi:CubicO group peptidase (beta-lactamase class C family)